MIDIEAEWMEFTLLDAGAEPEPDCPAYNKPGRILVEIHSITPKGLTLGSWDYRYELDVHDYDHDSGVYWIPEGEGFEYWFDSHIDLELPGWYVVEDVTGYYHRRDGWTTDDDVDWDFGIIRRATEEEIRTEALT